MLFIPALWAHHVEALHGPSVAVNVFWRELAAEAYPRKDLYANADPIAAAEALKLSEDAAGKLAGLPRQHRVFYGGLAVANVLRTLRIETEIVGLRCGTEGGRRCARGGARGPQGGGGGGGGRGRRSGRGPRRRWAAAKEEKAAAWSSVRARRGRTARRVADGRTRRWARRSGRRRRGRGVRGGAFSRGGRRRGEGVSITAVGGGREG